MLTYAAPKMLIINAPTRNEGWFEVIATVQKGLSRCFAFVHRLDRHARARVGSVLKSQGLAYHQPVAIVTHGRATHYVR